jgi:hypothetical protein
VRGTKSAVAFTMLWISTSTLMKIMLCEHIGRCSVARKESVASYNSGSSASLSLAVRVPGTSSGIRLDRC